MKTLYEVLKTSDRKKIIDSYIYTYGPRMFEFVQDDKHTPKQIIEKLKEKINAHMDFLLSFSPKPDETSVLIAYHIFPDSLSTTDDYSFALIKTDEEPQEYGYTCYSFVFSPTEEILGFHIADTYTTQYYLTELLAYVIHETSFFGWKRESVNEELKELDRRMSELESGEAKTVPFDKVMEELCQETDWVPEIRNKEEEEKEREVLKAIGAYNHFCLTREIMECQKLVKQPQPCGEKSSYGWGLWKKVSASPESISPID